MSDQKKRAAQLEVSTLNRATLCAVLAQREQELEQAREEIESYKKWFKDHMTVLALHRIGGFSFEEQDDE